MWEVSVHVCVSIWQMKSHDGFPAPLHRRAGMISQQTGDLKRGLWWWEVGKSAGWEGH